MKNDPGRPIEGYKYLQAQAIWDTFWILNIGKIPPPFHKFLGLTGKLQKMKAPKGMIHIRESAVRKIEKLCGPHGYTLLKAHQIRKHIK